MASFIGSVATKLGEGMQENAKSAAEEARELQLQKQRQMFESKLLDRRLNAEDKRLKRRIEADDARSLADREHAKNLYRLEQDALTTREGNRQQFEWEKTLVQEYSDMWQSAVNLYSKQSGTKSFSGNGLNVDIENKTLTELGPNGPIEKNATITTVYAKNRSPMQLSDGRFENVKGPNADNSLRHEWVSLDQQVAAERDLASGKTSEKNFLDLYRYLPADYVWNQVTQDDQGFESFIQSNGIKMPTFAEFISTRSMGRMGRSSGDSPRAAITAPAPAPTAADTGPPAPTTSLAAAAAAEDTGPPAEAAAAPSARTANVGSEWRASLTTGGGDMPDKLEQGDNLLYGPAAWAVKPQQQEQAVSPAVVELDDAGAMSVSDAIINAGITSGKAIVSGFKAGGENLVGGTLTGAKKLDEAVLPQLRESEK